MSSPMPEEAGGFFDMLGGLGSPFPEPGEQSLLQLVFLCGMYGFVLLNAATILSDGSELLLLVPSIAPVVGSIVLPILGAVPDGVMVLFSGLGDDAQNEISVGVGALAGSTIMLLTVPWTIAVVTGRVAIKDGKATYKRPKEAQDNWDKGGQFSLTHSGVGISQAVKSAARMMLLTLTGYIIIQGICSYTEAFDAAQVEVQAKAQSSFALVGLIVCIVEFVYYLKVSAAGDENKEERVIEKQREALDNGQMSLRGVMAHFREKCWPALGGIENVQQADLAKVLVDKDCISEMKHMLKLLYPYFKQYDKNGDGTLQFEEFRLVFKDLRENLKRPAQEALFTAADTDHSGCINYEEFVACMLGFALAQDSEVDAFKEDPAPKMSHYKDDDDEESEEEDMPEDIAALPANKQQAMIKRRAAVKMIFGTFLVIVFSDPMVDLLGEIGKRLAVSPFYISFVVAPFASNASELVAARNYAAKRTEKSMTTALTALEGAAIMNNTFCLGIFFALMYFKGLAWEFSAETFSIVLVQLLVAVSVMFRESMTLLNGLVILSFYPLSLACVYVLQEVLGFD